MLPEACATRWSADILEAARPAHAECELAAGTVARRANVGGGLRELSLLGKRGQLALRPLSLGHKPVPLRGQSRNTRIHFGLLYAASLEFLAAAARTRLVASHLLHRCLAPHRPSHGSASSFYATTRPERDLRDPCSDQSATFTSRFTRILTSFHNQGDIAAVLRLLGLWHRRAERSLACQ